MARARKAGTGPICFAILRCSVAPLLGVALLRLRCLSSLDEGSLPSRLVSLATRPSPVRDTGHIARARSAGASSGAPRIHSEVRRPSRAQRAGASSGAPRIHSGVRRPSRAQRAGASSIVRRRDAVAGLRQADVGWACGARRACATRKLACGPRYAAATARDDTVVANAPIDGDGATAPRTENVHWHPLTAAWCTVNART